MSQSFGGSKPGLAQAVARGCYDMLSLVISLYMFVISLSISLLLLFSLSMPLEPPSSITCDPY